MIRDDWDDWHMESGKLDLYLEQIRLAQQRFPQLTIKYGLEVDYLPGHEAWIRELSERHDWDYFIGSVHYISDSFDIDNPEKLDWWRSRDPVEIWSEYLNRLSQAAASGLFQIIGHPDLCKKFGIRPTPDRTPGFREFLETARDHETAIEINTAGLHKPCREMYPAPEILRLALETGVMLTFGSDAHAPDQVGRDFDLAVSLAKSAGYRKSCRFTRGVRELIPIP